MGATSSFPPGFAAAVLAAFLRFAITDRQFGSYLPTPQSLQARRFIASLAAMAEKTPADFVILHANVLTVDRLFSRAEAVAVHGDKIVLVGGDREVGTL